MLRFWQRPIQCCDSLGIHAGRLLKAPCHFNCRPFGLNKTRLFSSGVTTSTTPNTAPKKSWAGLIIKSVFIAFLTVVEGTALVYEVPSLRKYVTETYPAAQPLLEYYAKAREQVVEKFQAEFGSVSEKESNREIKEAAPVPIATVAPAVQESVPSEAVTPPKEQEEPTIEPVYPVFPFRSLDDVMNYLYAIHGRLSSLASTLPPTVTQQKEIVAILKHIDQQLPQIEKWQSVQAAEERHRLGSALKEQAAEFAYAIEHRVDEVTKALIESLKKNHEAAMDELNAKRDSELSSKLQDQNQALEKAYEEKIKLEAERLERKLRTQVQDLVDKERAGRLARLDHLILRVKQLEQLTRGYKERLLISDRIHMQWASFHSLLAILEQDGHLSFSRPLSKLREASHGDRFVTKVLQKIPAGVEDRGVVPISDLKTKFRLMSDKVRNVSLVPPDGGMESHVVSYLFSKLLFRLHGQVSGDDVESILARAEHHLVENEDVDSAAREINQLNGWSKKLAESWLNEAREHLEVKQAMALIHSHLALLSLLSAKLK